MLAIRVSVLDRLLGVTVTTVADALRIQSLIVSRQECARRAIESSLGPGEWPSYLVDPVGSLKYWPLPYPDTPTIEVAA